MRKVVLKSITAFERYREERKREDAPNLGKHPPAKLAKNNVESLARLLKTNQDKLPDDTYLKMKSHVGAIRQSLESAVKERDEEIEKFGELRSHEDAVAAIGLLTSYMAYEVAAPLDSSARLLADARKATGAAGGPEAPGADIAEYRKWLDILDANTTFVLHFVGLVRVLSMHIAASVARKGRPAEFSVSEAWGVIARGFRGLTDELGIEVRADVEGDLRIRSNRIDLETMLVNLFLNSVDALRDKTGGMKQIRFDADYSHAGLTIKISDNGKGVASEHLDRIFEPFYTAAEDPDNVAHGHGLGLAIVKKLAERHRGKTRAESPSPVFNGEGTTVTISFPPDSTPKVATAQ